MMGYTAALERIAQQNGWTLEHTLKTYAIDGVLRRLSQHPEAYSMVLTGSQLFRQWVPGLTARLANDLDFMTTFSYDVDRASELISSVLATPADDGLCFECKDDFLTEVAYAKDRFETSRLTVYFTLERYTGSFFVEISYGEPIYPCAVREGYIPLLGADFEVFRIEPELLFAWKLHNLVEQFPWRDKDLADLLLLQRHRHLQETLGMAIRIEFLYRSTDLDRLNWSNVYKNLLPERQEFDDFARWFAYAQQHAALELPSSLEEALRSVFSALPLYELELPVSAPGGGA